MIEGQASLPLFSEVQCVRLATYENLPGVEEELRRWEDDVRHQPHRTTADAAYDVKELLQLRVPEGRGVVMLADNVAHQRGPFDGETAARLCRQASALHRLPTIKPIGLTTVLLARVTGRTPNGDSTRSSGDLADALLRDWSDDGRPPIHLSGGPLASGVELWGPTDDLTHLVLLCDDTEDAERDAASRLFAPLWNLEVGFHKLLHQLTQVPALRHQLKQEREALQAELDRLSETLRQPIEEITPTLLRAAHAQNDRTTQAHCALIKTSGELRKARTTLEANRANLIAFSPMLGEAAGCTALDLRRGRADQEIAQIRADLDYCRPVLESVPYMAELHQTRLMTLSNISELVENKLRERTNWLVAVFGLWIGLMQITPALLESYFNRASFGLKLTALVGTTLLVLLGSLVIQGKRRHENRKHT